jgi:hypothetical protein
LDNGAGGARRPRAGVSRGRASEVALTEADGVPNAAAE